MTKQRGAVAPWHPLGWMAAVVRARWNDLLSQPVTVTLPARDGDMLFVQLPDGSRHWKRVGDESEWRRISEPEERRA